MAVNPTIPDLTAIRRKHTCHHIKGMDIRIVPKGIEILVAGAKGLLVGHALQLQTDAAGTVAASLEVFID